jgi:hypothetical protein
MTKDISEQPKDVSLDTTEEATEIKRERKGYSEGRKTVIELAKSGLITKDDEGDYSVTLLNLDTADAVNIKIQNLFGLNESAHLAITRVLEPDNVETARLKALIAKAKASGLDVTKLLD